MKIPQSAAPASVLEPGDYRARLMNAEAATSKSGNPMVKCVYQVTSPPADRGAELRDYVAFTEKAFWRVDIVAKALAVKLEAGEDLDAEGFADRLFEASRQGREVVLRVEHETSEEWGTQARIRKVLRLTDTQAKDVDPDLPVDEPEPEAAATGGGDVDVDDIPFRAEPPAEYVDLKGTSRSRRGA